MLEAQHALDRLVASASRLYTLPAVAAQVLELTRDPQVDTRALKECIENDPALTAKILRVVNSSLFGMSRHVSDLNQALALLGVTPLKLLVLGFSLPESLLSGLSTDVLHLFWRRALTKAVAARELSVTLWKLPGDEAFIAGLLQDIGTLVLLQDLGQPYARIFEQACDAGANLAALERHAMGFDHLALSGLLLQAWGLPEALTQAVTAELADEPGTAPASELAKILHLAHLLTMLMTGPPADLLARLLAIGARYRGLRHEQLLQLVESLEDKVSQLAGVLNLELPSGMRYSDLLIRAQAQLAEAAAEAAGELLSRKPAVPAIEERLLADAQALTALIHRDVTRAEARPEPLVGIPAHSMSGHGAPEPRIPSTRSTASVSRASAVAADNDPGLVGRLTAAATACRHARRPLSLLLVQVDAVDQVALMAGLENSQALLGKLRATCQSIDHPSAMCLQVGECRFAIVLPQCDRRAALEMGNQLVRQVRRFDVQAASDTRAGTTVSGGLATVVLPPKNFLPESLIEAASRCLHAAQISGGNALKSIELL